MAALKLQYIAIYFIIDQIDTKIFTVHFYRVPVRPKLQNQTL